MLQLYLCEPCNEPARRRLAAVLAKKAAAPEPSRERLVLDRRRNREQVEHLANSFAAALTERGIAVTRAKNAPAAATRVAALASGTPVAVPRGAVLGELRPALAACGVEIVSTYGPGETPFEARADRFWQLPRQVPTTSWKTRPFFLSGAARRDVVALLGVNAVSAATGAVHLLQHSHNIGDLLRTARTLIFVVGLDKIARDDAAAERQVKAIGAYGTDSVLLDLCRTQPLGEPLRRFATASEPPATEVILLDNGRLALLDGHYGSLFSCIGCRACAQRCPTYPAFRGPRGWSPRDYLWSHLCDDNPSLAMCTFCGNCERDCPLDIPLPTLIARRRAEAIDRQGRDVNGWRRRVQGDVRRLSRLLAATAPLGPRAAALPVAGPAFKHLLGLTSNRPLPAFRRDNFERWFARRAATEGGASSRPKSGAKNSAGRRLTYYFGCFANYNNPEVGHATVRILEALGYDVILPRWQCCGIPLYAKGEVDAARAMAAHNIAALDAMVNAGNDVVTSCPSCQLALTRDYPRLYPSAAARRVGAHTHFLSRFLLDAGVLDGALGSLPQRAAYHLPCHLRALGLNGVSPELLSMVPDLSVTNIDRGCCGLSGTFGFERAHYAEAMRIGRGIFARLGEGAFDVVLTDCGACKMQIEHGSGRTVLHPLEILWRALGQAEDAMDSRAEHGTAGRRATGAGTMAACGAAP